MSVPDMRACIQYAIYYPERNESVIDELDLTKICSLTFGTPDTKTFSLLAAAFYAAEKGGALPAVLNAANEVAVASFLRGEIKFGAITDAVNAVLDDMESASSIQTLEEIILADREARRRTEKLLSLI
jgi:1-deoxy-D-xylulose-5-phosphate reductoisomerase